MRSSFNLQLLVVSFLFVLIIGCSQQPIEESSSSLNPDNSEKIKPTKKVQFVDTPELILEKYSGEYSQMDEQWEDTSYPTRDPQPRGEEGSGSSQDTTNKEQDQEDVPPPTEEIITPSVINKDQKDVPPPPPDELFTPPVPPMTPKKDQGQLVEEESTNQEESEEDLQDTATELEWNTVEVSPTPPPSPFSYDESKVPKEEQKESITLKMNTPPPPPVLESKVVAKKDFPTIAQLNIDLGIDISHIDTVALEQKSIPTLESEFKKIQEAYETVKQTSTASNIAEDTKSLRNEELFRLNKPRKMYYEFIKDKIKKQKQDLLENAKKELQVKQDQLIKIQQDIEHGEVSTMGDLSEKIKEEQAAYEQLRSKAPKFSKYKDKGGIPAFNAAKQKSEKEIDEKEKELNTLKNQESSIKQKLSIQVAELNSLEREIAKLKKEPQRIEERFNKQIQDLEYIFDKKTKVDLVSSMLGNMDKSISQIEEGSIIKKNDPNDFEQDWKDE